MRPLLPCLIALLLAGCLSNGSPNDDDAVDDDDAIVDDDDSTLDDDDTGPDDDDTGPDDDDTGPDDDDTQPDDDDTVTDDDDTQPDDDDTVTDDDDSGPDDDDTAPDDDDTVIDDDDTAPIDADGDGYPADQDCDDGDPALNWDDNDGDASSTCDGDCDDADPSLGPSQVEICDGLDDDCDGVLPPGEADDDGDGEMVCQGDCDDADPARFTGASEACDGVDNDCDGSPLPDEVDDDGDGFLICDGDCDDADATIHPGAPDTCASDDDDCDGNLDPLDLDDDGDGASECGGDCDDGDALVGPGLPELCDGIDNDCDGNLPNAEADADGDGFRVCGDDCDDSDPAIYPGNGWDSPADTLDVDCGGGSDTSLAWAHAHIVGGAGDGAGTSVAFAGDVDGDGLDDLIVGAPFSDASANNAGVAWLFLGSTLAAGGTFSPLDADLELRGVFAGDRAGAAVASAGDVDGDGLHDLLIGAPWGNVSGQDVGMAYVVLGATVATAASPLSLGLADVVLEGDDDGDRAGSSVASAGDVDGDGLDDVLVGAWAVNNGQGEAYLTYGATLASGGPIQLKNTDVVFEGDNDNEAGWAVAGAGDVDGDGLDDLLIGGPAQNSGWGSPGQAWIVLAADLSSGQDELELADAWATVQCPNGWTDCGRAVASAGDVTGDGLADVLISSLGAWATAGTVYLFTSQTLVGGGTYPVGSAWMTLEGVANGDLAGDSLGSGDVDGDGIDDLFVGVPMHDGAAADVGAAGLLYGVGLAGGVQSLAGAFDEVFRDDLGGDESGRSLAADGDVNGDGQDDLIVGAPGFDGGAGRAVLLLSP